MNQRLYRSRDDRIIAGVAGGLAEQFNLDPSLVRILWVALAVVTAGVALLFYVVMAFIVPEEPAGDERWSAWQRRAGAYQWPEPGTPAATGSSAAAPGGGPDASQAGPTGPTSSAMPLAGAAAVSPGRSAPIGTEAIRGDGPARQEARGTGLGALVFGLVLILTGGYFLVRAYVPSFDVDSAWPILLVVIGILLLVGSLRRSSGPPA